MTRPDIVGSRRGPWGSVNTRPEVHPRVPRASFGMATLAKTGEHYG